MVTGTSSIADAAVADAAAADTVAPRNSEIPKRSTGPPVESTWEYRSCSDGMDSYIGGTRDRLATGGALFVSDGVPPFVSDGGELLVSDGGELLVSDGAPLFVSDEEVAGDGASWRGIS